MERITMESGGESGESLRESEREREKETETELETEKHRQTVWDTSGNDVEEDVNVKLKFNPLVLVSYTKGLVRHHGPPCLITEDTNAGDRRSAKASTVTYHCRLRPRKIRQVMR